MTQFVSISYHLSNPVYHFLLLAAITHYHLMKKELKTKQMMRKCRFM
jgi:hypothetical protein